MIFKCALASLFSWMTFYSFSAFAADLLEVPVGISPVMSSAALFIAKEKGYFKAEGMDVLVKLFKGSGAEMVPFLASGQLFVAVSADITRTFTISIAGPTVPV